MEFGKKKTISPLELSEELPKQLYPTEKLEERGRDYLVLNQFLSVMQEVQITQLKNKKVEETLS